MYKQLELIYENPLASPEDVKDFRMEGEGVTSFPKGKLRMENGMDPQEGQSSNFVFWCDQFFPDNIEISWNFMPIREPGLCILFFSALGKMGEDIFDPGLKIRKGPYGEYNNSDINAYHISYFRRRYPVEREFHTCNLRKSCGHHLVKLGPDPLPSVEDAVGPYTIKIVKSGPHIVFYINDMEIFHWVDDNETYGPILKGGKIGFRQMAPLMAEYENLKVHTIEWL